MWRSDITKLNLLQACALESSLINSKCTCINLTKLDSLQMSAITEYISCSSTDNYTAVETCRSSSCRSNITKLNVCQSYIIMTSLSLCKVAIEYNLQPVENKVLAKSLHINTYHNDIALTSKNSAKTLKRRLFYTRLYVHLDGMT